MELEEDETCALREILGDRVLLDDKDAETVILADLLKIGDALPPVAVIDAILLRMGEALPPVAVIDALLLKIGDALPPVAVIDATAPEGDVDEDNVPE